MKVTPIPALALLAAVIVDVSVLAHGLPMLRHDWRIPSDPAALSFQLFSYTSGWIYAGIGAPQPYPTFYIIALPLWALAAIGAPSVLVVAVVLTAATLLLFFSAAAIAREAALPVRAACGAFAALNPWVYSEYVAGHIFMVLGLGFVLALLAEMLRPVPRSSVLIAFAALAITQLEFFALALLPVVAWAVARRRYAVATAPLLAALPIAIGIVGDLPALREIPYLLPWQSVQSIPLQRGVLTLGAPEGYDRAFDAVWLALLAGALLAVPGLLRCFGNRFRAIVVLVCVCGVIFASGTTGPIAGLYAWIVVHVRASALFRELYDLIALAVVGIVFGWALAPRWKALEIPIAIVALAIVIPWLIQPPSRWFVPSSEIPRVATQQAPLARAAFLPAFQPLAFEGRGSGVDPDAFPRPGYAQPINTPELLYPVDAALGRLTRGDMSAVAALGVTEVIARGYFSPSAGGHGVTRRRVAPAVALFTYSTRPPAVTGVPDVHGAHRSP